ncbi:MAG TPA: SRPBCC family protein [Rudaea sp.]|nr:SRPBCC family protein [Rudaea sp.]
MTEIVSEIVIRRPVAAVFDYVTTPANWLAWHPSSIALRGATDHSLEIGEAVDEDFRVAGRTGTVTWKVVARERPTRWVIAGRVAAGGSGTITYTLRESPVGTEFRREFVYAMPNWFAALLDRLFVRRCIEAESAEAVRRLREALENPRENR